MRKPLQMPTLIISGIFTLSSMSGQASTVITQWNFNSTPPDATTTTGSASPVIGIGTIAGQGSINQAFADGTGSSDPVTSDDTGYNLSGGFPTQGTGNKSAGIAFMVSTSGYDSITFSFDQRNSNTASRYWALQYTLNGGGGWSDFAVSGANTNSGLFEFAAGSTWFNGLTVDLSGIPGASDNPDFGVRLLAAFDPASGTSYTATDGASNYGTTGTARFDMVTVSGNAIPEPSRALLLIVATVAAATRRKPWRL